MEKQVYAIPLVKVPVVLDTLYYYGNPKALRIKAPSREKAIATAWRYCTYHTKNSNAKACSDSSIVKYIYAVVSSMVKYTVSFTHPDLEVLTATSNDFKTQLLRGRCFRRRLHSEAIHQFTSLAETTGNTFKQKLGFYSDKKLRSDIERWLSVAQKCNEVLDYCVQTENIDDVCEIANVLGRKFR